MRLVFRLSIAIVAILAVGCGDEEVTAPVGTSDSSVTTTGAPADEPGSTAAPEPRATQPLEGPLLVAAVDPGTATVAWSVSITEETPDAADVFAAGDGVILVGDTGCSGSSRLLFLEGDGTILGESDDVPQVYGSLDTVGRPSDGLFVSAGWTDGGVAFAVGIETGGGTEAWRVDLPDLETGDLHGPLVVLAWQDGDAATVLGLDRATGAEVWRQELTGTRVGGVRVAGGLVAVTAARSVVVLDGADGSVVSVAEVSAGSDRISVELIDETVVGADPETDAVVGIDARTGEAHWRRSDVTLMQALGAESHGAGSGAVLVATTDGEAFVALDAASGDEVWRTGIGSGIAALSPAVIAVNRDGVLVGVDRADGTVRWELDPAGLPLDVEQFGAIALDEGRLFLLAGCAGRS